MPPKVYIQYTIITEEKKKPLGVLMVVFLCVVLHCDEFYHCIRCAANTTPPSKRNAFNAMR